MTQHNLLKGMHMCLILFNPNTRYLSILLYCFSKEVRNGLNQKFQIFVLPYLQLCSIESGKFVSDQILIQILFFFVLVFRITATLRQAPHSKISCNVTSQSFNRFPISNVCVLVARIFPNFKQF